VRAQRETQLLDGGEVIVDRVESGVEGMGAVARNVPKKVGL